VVEEAPAVPEWLTGLRVAPPPIPPTAEEVEKAPPTALPEWLFLEEEGAPPAYLTPPTAPTAAVPEAELPDWVLAHRPPEAPAAPAVPPPEAVLPEMPPGATPEEELPAWVRALKPAPLRATPAERAPAPARQVETGPPVLRDIAGGLHEDAPPIVLAGGRMARKEAPPLPSAELAASFEAVVKTPPEVTEPTPPRRRRGMLGGLFRRLLGSVLVLVIVAPLILGTGSAWVSARPRPATQGFADVITSVATGAAVLVLVDYDPGSQDEMNPVASAALAGLLARQARLVVLGLTPEGAALARQVIQSVAPAGYEYGQHYVIGYLAGEEAGLVRATTDLAAAIPQDAVSQEPWGNLAVTQGLQVSDFRLVLVIGNDASRMERWIAQLWARSGGQPPIVVASSTVAAPLLRPYWDTRQVMGILEGLPGAAEYESTVLGQPGRAAHLLDPLLYAHLAVIAFVLLGNLAFAFTRLIGS